ncbi:MAG: hypothetical protein CL543_09040 [Alcanivorax sp.]|nr:hypothetical protein [Alcanivorax sp.]MAY11995.1 hypothetical protein [Alcanivorax sp.]MBI55597.1 hypothetical protein [Alcanivorax sp.]MBU59012.1 hypothetical protein [Alcanivorax sp.]|tara:strand:- start:186 stop:707 length:522 start_codon:yes stop_codon:yes gene_type:complete
MPKYPILSPVKFGGEIHKRGELDCTEKEAAPLIKSGSLGSAVDGAGQTSNPVPGGALTPEQFSAAVAKLDTQNKSHWTNANKPEVKALAEVAGLKLKAADRDHLWAHHQAKNAPIEGVWVKAKDGTVTFGEHEIDTDGIGFADGVLTEEQLAELEANDQVEVEAGTFEGMVQQ